MYINNQEIEIVCL